MTTSLIVLNLLLLYVDESRLKPLPESNLYPLKWNNSDSCSGSSRVRRSIPEFDAVNPEYLDGESLSGEGPAGSQKYISPFALGDQVSNFFKSNKLLSKNANSPKGPARQVPSERAMRLAEAGDSVDDGGLRTDEQEECYKQQNMEPPGSGELEKRSQMMEQKTQPIIIGAKFPMTDVAYGPRSSFVRSEVLRKSGIHQQPQESDQLEIHSLYSEPEKQSKYKMKMKSYHQMKNPEVFNVRGRVYKPVEVQPKFPVYDEDIDFHPDPLQGILDEKYWLDPLEREAVIRKYIDLAANNMMPHDVEIVKRSATKENNVKRVNSKTELKGSDARCPCKEVKEVVGCKECKGKGQRNLTADDVGVSYGRKLLSVAVDEGDRTGDGESSGGGSRERGLQPNCGEKKVPSWRDEGRGEEEGDMDKDADHERFVFQRRRILSYDEDGESYGDDDEDEFSEDPNRSYLELNEQGSIYDIQNSKFQHHKGDSEPEEDDMSRSKEGCRNGDVNNEPQAVEDFTKLKDNNRILPQKYNFADTLNRPPAYYTPNKFANILQKPLKEKPKGPTTKVKEIDPNREFEVIRNETIFNATLELASKNPSDLASANNGVPNVTNVRQARQRPRQRSGRYRPDEPMVRSELDGDGGGYIYKDEYNLAIKKGRAAPRSLEEGVLHDDTVLGKQSGEMKRSSQNGRQSYDDLKEHRYVSLDQKMDDCVGYSYKDDLNISQYGDKPLQDAIEQSEASQGNRTLHKRWDDRRMYAHKGRRSFAALPRTKHSSVPLFQIVEDAVLSGTGGANTTLEAFNETTANTTYNTKAQENTTSATNTTNVPLLVSIDSTTTLRPNITSHHPPAKKAKNKDVEKEEDTVDLEVAKNIVETVISESQRSSVLGHHLGLCRRNESSGTVNFGRVVPETEKVIKSVTDCIMNRLKSHLERQSCVLLDMELLEFLQWLVLGGEPYKDYVLKVRGYHVLLPTTTRKPLTCESSTEAGQTTCEVESPPPLLHGTF